jgi:CheY-like chemotaxis protein
VTSASVLAIDERLRQPHSHAQTKRPRVLVADDDEDSRKGLERELHALGYDVMEASDGAQVLEALALAADGVCAWPDALVLDLHRSSFAGLDVLSALRGFSELPPTLMVSVLANQSVDVTVSTFRAKPGARKLELNAVLAAVLATACKRQVEQRARNAEV